MSMSFTGENMDGKTRKFGLLIKTILESSKANITDLSTSELPPTSPTTQLVIHDHNSP